jgi:heat-inducible transcriptional repressor
MTRREGKRTMLKSIPAKRAGKKDREYQILLGLVEYYLASGKPVGSNTLKEAGFGNLSSATIRNYFAQLEEDGYLKQLHSSGGRVPTELAYRIYAQESIHSEEVSAKIREKLQSLKDGETHQIAVFLQQAAEELSLLTNLPVFMSAPRFDHDFVLDVKLMGLDIHRCLCVIITDFGAIRTEVLQTESKLSSFAIKRIESYFHWRLTGTDKPEGMDKTEEEIAQRFYNEVMVRYVVGYSQFVEEEVHRTGFSRLLGYPDFDSAFTLSNSLNLFENSQSIRLILRECCKLNTLKYWIGDDLIPYTKGKPNCSVIAVPYRINQKPVGAVGILGPTRMPYKQLFGTLKLFSEAVSDALTRSLFKFKISFREPNENTVYYLNNDQKKPFALEDRRKL